MPNTKTRSDFTVSSEKTVKLKYKFCICTAQSPIPRCVSQRRVRLRAVLVSTDFDAAPTITEQSPLFCEYLRKNRN